MALRRIWKETCPACQLGTWGVLGLGAAGTSINLPQLAAGEVSEGNSFLSLLTWAGVELLTCR